MLVENQILSCYYSSCTNKGYHGEKSIDLDGNGYVDRSELRKYVNSTGFNVSENELDDLMKGIDDNEDGKISLEEFIASSVSRKLEKKED